VNPQQIDRLPAPLRADYLHAFTNSLSSVFLVAAAIAVVAFALTWLIRELPLRETIATGDLADTYAAPRSGDSVGEIANMIGRLNRREGAREIIARIAVRAGVDLQPAACWLLARLSEPGSSDVQTLAAAADVELAVLLGARDQLVARGLIAAAAQQRSGYALTPVGHATLQRLTATGEQRLSDLLQDWRPQEHEDLARLIATLAREFFIDASALRSALPAPV
jgi:hypothetical protein